jgi:homoserine O-acetyltransferase
MPVIAAVEPGPFLIGWLNVWAQPILLDPKWNGGDYYGKEAPNEGLAAALKVVSLHANQWQWADKAFGVALAEEGKNPAKEWNAKYRVEAVLDTAGKTRAASSDANHFLYLIKANQTFSVDVTKIKAPTLMIYAPTDLVFTGEIVEQGAAKIAANGTPVQTVKLTGPNGHLNGVVGMLQAKDQIQAFVDK